MAYIFQSLFFNLFLYRLGHFCPNGTVSATQHPCAAGTYNDGYGLRSQSECIPCLGMLKMLLC